VQKDGVLRWLREGAGAFSDGAILFPILFLLISRCGFSAPVLWLSTGWIYIAVGLYFRVPMPVQPLKSLAITAVALGATQLEVRWGSAGLGASCLLFSYLGFQRVAQRVPQSLVHGIQLALGVLLIGQAYQMGIQNGWGLNSFLEVSALGIFALLAPNSIPVLGILAVTALVSGIVNQDALVPEVLRGAQQAGPRLSVIAALVLPQIPLTLANSVMGTYDVSQRYFGAQAKRVTPQALLRSIGFGNGITAIFGGIPFCHGAGGMTAHYRGGARSSRANFLIGGFLLVVGGIAWVYKEFRFEYPLFLWVSLLGIIGVFHLKLAAPTWSTGSGKMKLLLMGSIAAATRNMFWVLAMGVVCEGVQVLAERFFRVIGAGPKKNEG
jgi:SulP family sulfate permease